MKWNLDQLDDLDGKACSYPYQPLINETIDRAKEYVRAEAEDKAVAEARAKTKAKKQAKAEAKAEVEAVHFWPRTHLNQLPQSLKNSR